MTYNGLHPVHGAGSHPYQIPGLLNEAVHRDVLLVQILQYRPPGTGQVVQIVPTTQTQAHADNVGLGLTRSSLKLTFIVYNLSSLNFKSSFRLYNPCSLNFKSSLRLYNPCSLNFKSSFRLYNPCSPNFKSSFRLYNPCSPNFKSSSLQPYFSQRLCRTPQ